jgi:hypothetical protein
MLASTKLEYSTSVSGNLASRRENMILDFSSASSNTGSGGTKQALSANQLAEVCFGYQSI